jgi:hypothetical protein
MKEKIVIFNKNGLIVPQSREIEEELGNNPHIVAHSPMKKGVKFIAVDVDHKMVILEFTPGCDGRAKIRHILDNFIGTCNQLINNNDQKEDDIYHDRIWLTDECEIIKSAARVELEEGHVFKRFTSLIDNKVRVSVLLQ